MSAAERLADIFIGALFVAVVIFAGIEGRHFLATTVAVFGVTGLWVLGYLAGWGDRP